MIDEKKLNTDDLCDICSSADCANCAKQVKKVLLTGGVVYILYADGTWRKKEK